MKVRRLQRKQRKLQRERKFWEFENLKVKGKVRGNPVPTYLREEDQTLQKPQAIWSTANGSNGPDWWSTASLIMTYLGMGIYSLTERTLRVRMGHSTMVTCLSCPSPIKWSTCQKTVRGAWNPIIWMTSLSRQTVWIMPGLLKSLHYSKIMKTWGWMLSVFSGRDTWPA